MSTKSETLAKFIHLDDHLKAPVLEDLDKFITTLASRGIPAEAIGMVRESLGMFIHRGSGLPDQVVIDVWGSIISEGDAVRLLQTFSDIPENLRVLWLRMMLQAQILALVESMKGGLARSKEQH